MELISGRRAASIRRAELLIRIAHFEQVALDLGAGDGQYVLDRARRDARCFAIGVDACRENLRDASRRAPHNALFAIANALTLPDELDGIAGEVTINFPWGSLLRALIDGDAALFDGLGRVARPGARLLVRLNASALAEAGLELERGGELALGALRANRLCAASAQVLERVELRRIASSWAKRLAFGRDPRALELRAAWASGRSRAAA